MSRTEKTNIAARIYENLDPYKRDDLDITIADVENLLTTDPYIIIENLLTTIEEEALTI